MPVTVVATVDLFSRKIFSGKKKTWDNGTHKNYFTRTFFMHSKNLRCLCIICDIQEAAIGTHCENEPWSVVESGIVSLPNSDRLSTTHLLFDLARTSASCTRDVLITVPASSSRCW